MSKLILNMTKEQLRRMAGEEKHRCDHNTPIIEDETLEPNLRGGDKILGNPEKKDMMYRIYMGVRNKNGTLE